MILYHAPERIAEHHVVDDFSCGVESMDLFLKKRALANDLTGASRTFVATDDGATVAGYYSLATGSVLRQEMPGSLRRNSPEPIPVLVIGRLAVDVRHQEAGLGRSLLSDALHRCAASSRHVGFMAVIVHPVDDAAAAWWERRGFDLAPTTERTMYVPLKNLQRLIAGATEGRPGR